MRVHISSPWIKLGLFLLCGVFVSWLTTWPQAWSKPFAENVTHHRSDAWDEGRMVWAWEVTPKRMSRVLTGAVASKAHLPQGELTEAPAWTTFTEARSELDPASVSYLVSGWPVECFRSTSIPEPVTQGTVQFRWDIQGGIPIGSRNSFAIAVPPRNIPLVPLWPGLLVSTLFWGSATFAIVLACQNATHFVRVRSRRKHGLCPNCSYAMKELGRCPECGESASATPRGAIHTLRSSHG